MDVPFQGGCACGAVRYECSLPPLMAFDCHCRDCQRASGMAYASGMLVPEGAFRFTKRSPRYHTATADGGRSVGRGFCAECGSLIAATQAGHPIVIYASSLDDPSWHRPTMEIFTASAQPWDPLNSALAQYPRGLEG